MKMINGHIACVLINTNPSLDNEKKKKARKKKPNQTKKPLKPLQTQYACF